MQWGLERSIFVVIVLAAARFDFLPFIFNCWFAPALMVGVTLGSFLRLPPASAVYIPQPLDERPDLPRQADELADHGAELSPGSSSLAFHSLV